MTLLAADHYEKERHRSGQPSPGNRPVAIRLDGLSVLVVDDESDARRLMKRFLEIHGARVSTAASVGEALTAMERDAPDVILSDIGMPDRDGYELISHVRRLPPEAGGDTPAAAVTAFVRDDDRARALRSGFQMHLAKPVDPQELLCAVTRLAQGHTN